MAGRGKIGTLLVIAGCCCILAAAALYGYNGWISSRTVKASDQLIEQLTAMMGSSPSVSADSEALTQPGASGAGKTDTSLQTVTVDGNRIIGVLSIPAIQVKLAVISEWSYANLNIAACRYSGTPDNHLVVLGHNYKRLFGSLYKLKAGDSVLFTRPDGVEYQYTVTGTETKHRNQFQEVLSGDWDLTLFTCTFGGADRVVVRCKRIA